MGKNIQNVSMQPIRVVIKYNNIELFKKITSDLAQIRMVSIDSSYKRGQDFWAIDSQYYQVQNNGIKRFIRIQNNEPEYHWVKASDLILYSQFSNINGDSFVKEQIGCDANLSFLGLFEGNREELRACKKDCGNQYPAYFGQWTERRDCKTSCKAKWDLDQSQIISDEDMPSGYVPPSNQGSGANGNTNNQSTTNNTNTQTTTGNTGTTGGLPTPTHTRINDELSNNSEAERFNEKDWEEETTKDNKTNTETKENKIPSTGTNAALKYGIITLLSIGALVGVYFMFFRNKGKGKSTAKTTV